MGIGIGDVTTVFAILAALGIVFPGLLLAWSLLMPNVVERARERVRYTPWKSFFLGALGLFFFGLPSLLLLRAAGPLQFFGFVSLFALMTVASFGAAGIASLMGERLRGQGIQATTPGGLLRGAVALEFAVMFPFVGWFILFPFVVIVSFGAAVFALLRWSPRAGQMTESRLPMANSTQPVISHTPSAVRQ